METIKLIDDGHGNKIFKMKVFFETEVYVETDKDELDIETANKLADWKLEDLAGSNDGREAIANGKFEILQ